MSRTDLFFLERQTINVLLVVAELFLQDLGNFLDMQAPAFEFTNFSFQCILINPGFTCRATDDHGDFSAYFSAAESLDQLAYGSAQEFLVDFADFSSQHRLAISQQFVNVVESIL